MDIIFMDHFIPNILYQLIYHIILLVKKCICPLEGVQTWKEI